MAMNLAQKLIQSHLVSGSLEPGSTIALKIDQTLTQDATGTMVMLEFEALGLPRVKTEISAQYVDHNLLQTDFKNADDHLFLQSACRKYGLWYSRPGNGVSHPVHMSCFGIPGKTLLGSDSHTCAAGSMGMLAIGAGGLQVAMAMAGLPFAIKMPKILGVKLVGELPPWVSAKDIILEMLRRYTVKGCVNTIVEYHGPGLKQLTAMDRHVIANMGQEMGATASVFPADEAVRAFLKQQQREADFVPLQADEGATYDEEDTIDLSKLEPLIACPSSPDKVVPVREVAGRPIYQSYIGSSANPGLRDFVIPARMVADRRVDDSVSFDINPTSRQLLEEISRSGDLATLLEAGARLHQTGCGGCIGMGQAPASGRISLRTVPRNFPGRSGTEEDQVYLCSPEVATASALTGKITDPRDLEMDYPEFTEPEQLSDMRPLLQPPQEIPVEVELVKGPNIKPLPDFEKLPEVLKGPLLLKAGDNVSTDEILPAGAEILPLRSNIPAISRYAFCRVDENFYQRAMDLNGDCFVVGGDNYGQGSSREHAAIAPRYLGVRCVIAKSMARIHRRNLINFGILPLLFDDPADYDKLAQDAELEIDAPMKQLKPGQPVNIKNNTSGETIALRHDLSPEEIETIKAGGLINEVREKHLLTGG
ncbi:aconitate hydratase [Microbulbifer thermotolerans]|uniref:aconitate hydratase n=1 Tax=Microbulbifer thermotolerans TaxID=252514 RepID=UPI00224B285D|nr:aconitate hydratase [Microbulbifer thermotolerans]MCX2781116.1 aconitate hydratase [Microbulbifer thermotolerans]MCX2804733.1 aconitate hydratase [Microbulbifer thermotolerans]